MKLCKNNYKETLKGDTLSSQLEYNKLQKTIQGEVNKNSLKMRKKYEQDYKNEQAQKRIENIENQKSYYNALNNQADYK